MSAWQQITDHIRDASGEPFQPESPRSLGGGCINTAVRLSDGNRHWFVKLNQASRLDMFEAEFLGLQELAAAEAIRVPLPLCTGTADGQSYIVMEFIPLGGSGSNASAGEQLAALHRHQAEAFGWQRDNTIGSTHQPNDWTADWVDFWRKHRLGFQLEEAARKGLGSHIQRLGENLLERFSVLMDHDPAPSLLHGDLWGGNLSHDDQGNPVIYDPATYYGDREAEIAMTELFGGFGAAFYDAYNSSWPLDSGYATRKTFYNLYHILNHANMFGGGYVGQAQRMMERLLADLG
ncbi:fructosamine kinase family protein [Thiolapillus brandeum]|uniref:fructosamine kinase family protein n=1 Tax=Thiolapillus brandeum TaxID=1076588 RepID=UPI000597C5A9|nr:fructosamine kinase family protein [Thiolapillus brandeum]